MEVVKIIVSILMFVIVLIAIQKKFNPVTTLLMTGTLVLVIWGIATGVGAIDPSTGSAFMDSFEYFKTACISYFSSGGIIIMSVLGYVAYMNHLKATNLFAQFLSAPLKKIKNPYIVGALVVLLAHVFVTALPSGVAIVALLFGVVFPVMRKVGLTAAASASAITLGCASYLGPGNPGLINVLLQFGNPLSPSELFAKMLPYSLIYIVVSMIVYMFTSRFFDKHEGSKALAENAENKADENEGITRPKWYAVFPILPIVFTIVFSSLVAKSIVISAVGACFLSFCIVFVVELIYKRKAQETFAEATEFYKGMGHAFGMACMVGIAGTVFSTALSTVGGIQILAKMLTSISSLTPVAIIVFFSLVYALLFYVTGTFAISMFTILPILNTTFTAMGRADLILPTMMCALLVGQCIGQAVTPISAATLFISGATGVAPTTVSKRNIIPALVGGIAAMIAVLIFVA